MLEDHSIKALLIGLLTEYPELRDNDRRLCCNVWATTCDIRNMSAVAFLKLFAAGDLAHPESIRRHRQKLQELHPALRGEKYELRHKKLEPEVRKQVKNYDQQGLGNLFKVK
jgi:hypothetical protein